MIRQEVRNEVSLFHVELRPTRGFRTFGRRGYGRVCCLETLWSSHEPADRRLGDKTTALTQKTRGTKYHENTICIIDEIHRMKKDIQDFLLPFAENGSLIIIGLTTENPYRSINPAIRSRCHIYRMILQHLHTY